MLTRREFINSTAAALAVGATATAAERTKPKTMAIVSTEWRKRSHSQHMGDRFLHGYPTSGRWKQPRLKIVSLYAN